MGKPRNRVQHASARQYGDISEPPLVISMSPWLRIVDGKITYGLQWKDKDGG
jgi:hypothetical protein